jgi:hypothetical protein
MIYLTIGSTLSRKNYTRSCQKKTIMYCFSSLSLHENLPDNLSILDIEVQDNMQNTFINQLNTFINDMRVKNMILKTCLLFTPFYLK